MGFRHEFITENAIKVTVESYCDMDQPKSVTIQRLIQKCGLSEQEAEEKFLQYAPEGYIV